MRKSLLLVCALLLSIGASAQKVVTDDIHRTEEATTPKSTAHGIDEEVNYMNSGAGLDYMAIEEGFGLGLSYAFNYLLIDVTFRSADNDYFDSTGWSAGIGGQYRYWFGKRVFIEGRAGVQYMHVTTKIKGMDEKEKNGDFGLFITPRIGFRLFNDVSIVAGYRWDFNKFKFKKDYTADYFTIGIHFVM